MGSDGHSEGRAPNLARRPREEGVCGMVDPNERISVEEALDRVPRT